MTASRADVVERPAAKSLRRPSIFDQFRRFVAAVPAPLWLGVFIVVSASLRYVQLTDLMPVPWIFPDELIYSELARSFGTSGHFAIRDVPFHELSFGITYPILIAPAYAVTDDLPQAYAIARAINCAVMALAAVPAYLLGLRLLRPSLALLGAVLAVEIPSMAYSGTILSENLFYPVFLFTVLAIVRAVERPTALRQVGVLAAILMAILTRLEALALVPAYVSAIALLAWLDSSHGHRRSAFAQRLAAYRLTWITIAGSAVAIIVFELGRGQTPHGLLGAYAVVTDRYSLGDVPQWFVYHLADLDLYVGIIPFAAAAALALTVLQGRERSRPVKEFVLVSLAVVGWLTLLVAAYATQAPAERVHERYLFYVVPLFLIAFLVWVDRGLRWPARVEPVSALVAAALPAALPFDLIVSRNMQASTPGLLPWGGFTKTLAAPSYAWALALALGVLGGLLFIVGRRRLRLVLPVLVLLNFAVIGFFVTARYGVVADGAAKLGAASERDWIDRAVPRDSTVVALWSGRFRRGLEGRYAIWENEIFNRSVGAIYDLREPLKRYTRETRTRIDPSSGVLSDLTGRPVRARYVLSDVTFPLVGSVVARDVRTGVVLYAVGGVVRAAQVPART
jgi:hypothetical protein